MACIAGEAYGVRFTNLTPSYIPCLISRSTSPLTPSLVSQQTSSSGNIALAPAAMNEQVFVSIAPDVKDDLGHYLHYEKVLQQAFTRAGIPMVSLANKAAVPLQKEFGFLTPLLYRLFHEINRMDRPAATAAAVP